jgi:multidrug transporter EmrE-like cation transporter
MEREKLMAHLYIFGTILFTVYGQLIIKWRIPFHGALPGELTEKIVFLLKLFFDPFILSGFVAAFLASLCWMAAMTAFDLSYAYPFMGLNFVLVFLASAILLSEQVTLYKVVGLALIVLGIVISSRG